MQVVSNHFRVKVNDAHSIGLWRVSFDSSRALKSDRKKQLFEVASKELKQKVLVFDGGSIFYSSSVDEDITKDYELQTIVEDVVVRLIFIRSLPYNSISRMINYSETNGTVFETMNGLNIVLKNAFLSAGFISTENDTYHDPSNQRKLVSATVEVSFGVRASIIPVEKELNLVANQHATLFYREIKVMDLFEKNVPVAVASKNLEQKLKGVRVRAVHLPNFTFVVDAITREAANNLMFETENGSISVAEYFGKKYQSLKNPNCVCIQTCLSGRTMHFPLEVCEIAPAQIVKNPNVEDSAKLIRLTGQVLPKESFEFVFKALKRAFSNSDTLFKAFQIRIFNQRLLAKVVQIEPPLIKNASISKNAEWKLRRFMSSQNLSKLTIVSMLPGCEALNQKFVQQLIIASKEKGVEVFSPRPVLELAKPRHNISPADIEKVFIDNKEDQLILFLNVENDDHYRLIKYFGDVKYGIPNQCVRKRIISKPSFSCVYNILLKINVKTGGLNQDVVFTNNLQPLLTNMMVFGADIFHPGIGQNGPSVAAVVANADVQFRKYVHEIRIQPARKEMIVEMKDITTSLLHQYHKHNGTYPERILFYRDGVAHSQFEESQHCEVKAIKEACASLNIDPKLTFLIIQKRQNSRFCTISGENIQAGSLIECDVIRHKQRETDIGFILCPHFGALGTSKPAHYVSLTNDLGLNTRQLASLTNSFAFLCDRSSKAISMPVQAYYAHLAAYQGSVHLRGKALTHNGGRRGSSEQNINPKIAMYFE